MAPTAHTLVDVASAVAVAVHVLGWVSEKPATHEVHTPPVVHNEQLDGHATHEPARKSEMYKGEQ